VQRVDVGHRLFDVVANTGLRCAGQFTRRVLCDERLLDDVIGTTQHMHHGEWCLETIAL
jgi:hypothetical protein